MSATAETDLPADLQPLLTLWCQRRGGRRFPAWESVTAEDLAPWINRIHVIAHLSDGDFFFHRFSPVSAARLGFDMSGRRLSEIILSPRATASTSSYRRCLSLARPLNDTVPADFNDGAQHTAYDRLLLPFGSGEKPDLLLAALSFRL